MSTSNNTKNKKKGNDNMIEFIKRLFGIKTEEQILMKAILEDDYKTLLKYL